MTDNDVYQFFKDSFNIWEKHTARYWDHVLRNPLFLDLLGKNLELSLTFQNNLQKTLEQSWRAWGIPTRQDQLRTLHTLNELDTQVRQLSRRVDQLLDRRAAAAGPKPLANKE